MQSFHRERIRNAIADAGLDTLIASAPENVYYVTGHWSVAGTILRSSTVQVILDQEGEVVGLILPAGDVANFTDAGFDPDRIWAYGRFYFEGGDAARPVLAAVDRAQSGPERALASALQALGRARGRIGFDDTQVSYSTWQTLREILPEAVLVPAAHVFRWARLVKSPAEVACLKRAAEIAEESLLAALETAAPGITEQELARRYEAEVVARGGAPFFTVVTFGERAALADTPPSRRALRPGDIMRFDLGAVYRGYRSDIARTAVCGEGDPRFEAYYRAILAGEDAAIAAARAGVPAGAIFDAAVETVRSHGIAHYRRHHVGHAIGLEVYESLTISPGVSTPLASGMVLCLETPYYEIGWGGLQVEDVVHVTDEGAVLLTKTSRELLRVPG